MTAVARITVRRLRLPLPVPYKASNLVFTTFDPIVVHVTMADGGEGWGEAVVGPGYTDETDASAWTFCTTMARRLPGASPEAAVRELSAHLEHHAHAASVLISAIEMARRNPYLERSSAARVGLLRALNKTDPEGIRAEVEALLGEGYGTFKIKIGFGVEDDLQRVGWIQRAVDGRARLRLDANQAYSVAQARAFMAGLDPAGIELLEQPCDKADWEANAQAAARANVPIMLDESIYSLDDVRRAAAIEGVKFVKVKINKLGGVQRLGDALREINATALRPVLGNGVATDISCWMEAAVASHTIDTVGEMNGWLKLPRSLFANPLRVRDGAIDIPAGYWPEIDGDAVEAFTVDEHVAELS
jgi:L-alanine-DL-glutamate epimerase-like enolase superfamily enzyme